LNPAAIDYHYQTVTEVESMAKPTSAEVVTVSEQVDSLRRRT